ncbi:MAG: sodium:solute symporter family protein [Planctomycetota bacterium]
MRRTRGPAVPESTTILDPTLGWVLLAGFGVAWIALGIYWGRRARDLEGFMVAGRNVGLALGTATAVATWITSNTTMLAPQFALQLGVWGMLAYSTASIGLFLFAPLARRIRRLMPRGYTSVEFVRLRYGRVAHAVFIVISLFYCLTWMVSMAMAGGKLLEVLAGIPYLYGMSVILAVCVIYTLFGGLYAVIGTDFIQSVVILIGIVVVAVAVMGQVSIESIHERLVTQRPALLDALFPAAIMALFNNMFFGIGEIVHSNVWWSRAFAMREDVGPRAYLMAGLLWLPVPVVAGFLGLAAPAMGMTVTSPDVVGPLVAAEVLGSVGAVLVFIVVFCSLASSIDSLLAATSDVVTTEIVRPVLMPEASPASLRKAASAVIVAIGVATWLICLPKIGTLATVLFFAGPLVGSAIFPIVAGLYWERASSTAAVLAMVLGSVVGLVAYFQIGWYTAALVGTAVSFIITMTGAALNRERFDFARLAGAEASA